MADINLSKAVRSNLLSLQSTAAQMAKTQERLATGLKVNSALDNPTNFFTAAALSSRAGDMANLLDSMTNGISTIEAADNGLKSITKTVESMQSTLRQARQDKSFKAASYAIDAAATGNISFSGGAVGTSAVDIALVVGTEPPPVTAGADFIDLDVADGDETYTFDVTVDGGAAVNISLDDAADANTDGVIDINEAITAINAQLGAATSDIRVRESTDTPGRLEFFVNSGTHEGAGASILIDNFAVAGTSPSAATSFGFGTSQNSTGTEAVRTVDQLVTAINAHPSLGEAIRASNDSGKLRIENLSTTDLNVVGIGADGEVDGSTGTAATRAIDGNSVRENLVEQFNHLRDQLDKFADDASFNGINLLRGDLLKLTFNETGTSTIEIQAKDAAGAPTSINNTTLGIERVINADFDSDDTIDSKLDVLADALGKLRAHASSFGSNLSIVQNRTDFTKNMINTLETGAANLTLADTNEEAANLLALQTRQQLSSTALSMASQADQAVLRLF